MFRFTIRELVLVTVIVAMGVAWWSQQKRLKKDAIGWKHRAAAAKLVLRSRGWEVNWDGDDTEFRLGDELMTSPMRKDGRYVVHVKRESKAAISLPGGGPAKAKGPYDKSPPPWLSQ